jgi:hypothetical protein
MPRAVISTGGDVKAGGTCLQVRGLADLPLIEGVRAGTIRRLAQ